MPDLLGWIETVLRRPGLTWMLAVVVVSTVLVGIAYGAWRLMEWLSDRVWAWRHPPGGPKANERRRLDDRRHV